MDLEGLHKRIGYSLESNVRDSYDEFIRGVEDYENQWGDSHAGLWDLFSPIHDALANSRPPSIEKEEWARDLILAYRNVNVIKSKLLEELKEEPEGDHSNPLDDL